MSDNAETIDSLLAELGDILVRMSQRGLVLRVVRADWNRIEHIGCKPSYLLNELEVEGRVQ